MKLVAITEYKLTHIAFGFKTDKAFDHLEVERRCKDEEPSYQLYRKCET